MYWKRVLHYVRLDALAEQTAMDLDAEGADGFFKPRPSLRVPASGTGAVPPDLGSDYASASESFHYSSPSEGFDDFVTASESNASDESFMSEESYESSGEDDGGEGPSSGSRSLSPEF